MNIKREIFEVHIGYVNSDGYHSVDPKLGNVQYPIVIDSRNSNDDIEKTLKKAHGYLGAAENTLSTRDDQVSYCYIVRVSDGRQIEKRLFGKIADIIVPDPEPTPTPDPEPENNEEPGA